MCVMSDLWGRQRDGPWFSAGNAGKGVRKGDIIAENVSDDKALEVIGKALAFIGTMRKRKSALRVLSLVSVSKLF